MPSPNSSNDALFSYFSFPPIASTPLFSVFLLVIIIFFCENFLHSSLHPFILPTDQTLLMEKVTSTVTSTSQPVVIERSTLHRKMIYEPIIQEELERYNIALMCVSIGMDSPVGKNHQSYADRWNYDYIQIQNKLDDRMPERQKFAATLRVMNAVAGYTHVFWLDADAFFTNCSESLEKYVWQMQLDNSSWLFSGDNYVINSAQILWKNDQIARVILTTMDDWVTRMTEMEKAFWRDNEVLLAYLGGANLPTLMELEKGLVITSTCQRNGDQMQCRWNREGDRDLALHMVPIDRREKLSYIPYGEINQYEVRSDTRIFHCAGIKHGELHLVTTHRCIHHVLRSFGWPSMKTCSEIHPEAPPYKSRKITTLAELKFIATKPSLSNQAYICRPGQGPSKAVLREVKGNSYQKCGDECSKEELCHGFDFTQAIVINACRLYEKIIDSRASNERQLCIENRAYIETVHNEP